MLISATQIANEEVEALRNLPRVTKLGRAGNRVRNPGAGCYSISWGRVTSQQLRGEIIASLML